MAAAAERISASDGCGSGSATVRLSSAIRPSMGVDLLEVIGDSLVRDMPLAVVARGHFRIALGAEERSAVEELLHPLALRLWGCVNREGYCQGRSAPVARVLVFPVDHRLVVVVKAAWNDSRSRAKGAGHGELGEDRLGNELALVLEFAEEFGQVLLDLERHNGLLLRLPGHGAVPRRL